MPHKVNVASNIEFLSMFHAFGIDERQIKSAPPTFNINAFKNKKADGMVIFTTNELYELQRENIKFHIFNPSDYGASFYNLNLFTSRQELIDHPQRVQDFTEASIKGWKYALAHKHEIINLILKKYNTQHKSRKALEFEAQQTQAMILPSVFAIGSIDPFRVRRIAQTFKELHLVPKDTPLHLNNFIYHSKSRDNNLTTEQSRFLHSRKVLKICVNPDWMPIDAIVSGKSVGIAADLFHILQQQYHIQLQLYPTTTWQQSLQAAQTRKCDILTAAAVTRKRLKYMDFTKPYLRIPLVLATKMDKPYTYNFYTLRGKKIGVVRGQAIGSLLKKQYPKMDIVYVRDIQEGLREVESGKIYGYADNLMSLAYAIQRDFTNQIKISARINEDINLAIGTRNDEPVLHAIFQKLLDTISAKEKQQVINNWISVKENTKNMIDYPTLFKLLAVLLLIGLAFLYHYYRLRKYSKELQKLSITDSLTGVYNRMFIDTALQKQQEIFQRYNTPCGIIMLDIDFFKKVNDTYGHQVGDEVLQTLTKLIQQKIRKTDIIGRWGGEEFFILCPNTDLMQTQIVANYIKEHVANHKFLHVDTPITVSMGACCFEDGIKVDDIIKKVDDALYRSKKEGRNKVSIAYC